MDSIETLRTRAQAWLLDDPDPVTKAELEKILQESDDVGLADRFGGTLTFGTAGLRGLLGSGPNRMNRSMVIRATAGLAAWVQKEVPDALARGVAIGFDGRRMSREFAEDAARVLLGAGFAVHAFKEIVATPILAYAVLETDAAAGIMITASHNPPEYNGYKVYWENGAQIIPPHDKGISRQIAAVERLEGVKRVEGMLEKSKLFRWLPNEIVDRYIAGVQKLVVHRKVPRDIGIAYTALHGVGDRFARRALAEAGFTRVASVKEQAEPDGGFPTVAFPNPEEEGAMDLVLALAGRENADLVLANDPDADRLAVAVRDGDGSYVMLTGNEIGCMLAHYLLDQRPEPGSLVISTVVSSPMLGAIAEQHGATCAQTLTGFKWIANRALEMEAKKGLRFTFGYEEALGYSVGTLVRDKDGISAAVVMADMAAWCKSQGRTLLEERVEMWRRYGMFLSKQISIVLPGAEGLAAIRRMMERARSAPATSIGGNAVTRVDDYLARTTSERGKPSRTMEGPTSDVLVFSLSGGHRVMMRPSGTEPKLKLYHDVRIELGANEETVVAVARGNAVLDEIVTTFRSYVDGK